VIADVRFQTFVRGVQVISEAILDTNNDPRLIEPRCPGIARLASGVQGFEESKPERASLIFANARYVECLLIRSADS
jgi:hypothetical protein